VLCQPLLAGTVRLEEILDRPGDAVALGLPGEDDRVVPEQPLDQRVVPRGDRLAVRPVRDLRPQHGVVLCERVRALDLEVRLATARDRVEEHGFLDGRDESVPDPAEHRVVGPDREVVLPAALERAGVVQEVPLPVLGVHGDALEGGRVHAPASALDVVGGNERVRGWVSTLVVDEVPGVEDLHRLVRVHRRDDARDRIEVLIDELAQAPVVVERARAAAPRDEELELGQTEGVLDVDEHDAEAEGILVRRAQRMLARPLARFSRTLLVPHRPDLADAVRRDERRDRQHGGSLEPAARGPANLRR
jgi:hypothetical protein